VLAGDAYDLLATRIAEMPIAPPADLAGHTMHATSNLRAWIAEQFRARVDEAISGQLAPVYCLAAARYEAAVAIDPSNARATDQLRRYSGEFVRRCALDR
jgi:hypothetical protein